jgi:hypothetical protein
MIGKATSAVATPVIAATMEPIETGIATGIATATAGRLAAICWLFAFR